MTLSERLAERLQGRHNHMWRTHWRLHGAVLLAEAAVIAVAIALNAPGWVVYAALFLAILATLTMARANRS